MMNFRFPLVSRDGGKTIEHSDADGAKHLPRSQGLADGLALVISGGKWVASAISGVSVASVFGRTGNVVAQTGDYTAAQVGALGATAQAVDSAKLEGYPASHFQAAGTGLALGESASTAYRGDRGKAAFDHSQITEGNPHGADAVDVGAMPLLDLSGSPTLFDFNDVNGGLSCIASVQWSGADINHHGPGSFGSGALYQTPDGYGGILQMFVNRLTLGVHTRERYQGAWSLWILGWSTSNLTGFRGEHHHDSCITKAASYDFTGVTANLIKHEIGVQATLSGGVPGRKYTLICFETLSIIVPAGVTLYATAGIYAGPTTFSVGGMRPVMIQCMSATEWLIPNYGE